MMRAARPGRLALGLFVLLGAAVPAAAQDDTPLEGAPFLLLPPDPKAVGLGRAVTAMAGAESVWWNPAGLAGLTRSRFLVSRGENVGGEATAASVTLVGDGLGTLGFSYQLLDFGSIPLTDDQNNVVGDVSQRNHLAILSLATDLWNHVGVGLNAKLIQNSFSCRASGDQCVDGGVTGTTFAIDAGVQAHGLWGRPIRLGAVLAHLGPDLQVVNEAQADPLPTRIRIATAYEVLERLLPDEPLDLWMTVELDDHWRDPGDPAIYFGGEFVAGLAPQVLRLRAGYVMNADAQVDGAAVGLGVQYENFDLAIAKSLASSIVTDGSEPVHVSFGFVF